MGSSFLSVSLKREVMCPLRAHTVVGQTQDNHCKYSCSKMGKMQAKKMSLIHSSFEILLGKKILEVLFNKMLFPPHSGCHCLEKSLTEAPG